MAGSVTESSIATRYHRHIARVLDDLADMRKQVLATSFDEVEVRRGFRQLASGIDGMKGFAQEFHHSEQFLTSLLKPLLDEEGYKVLLNTGSRSEQDRALLRASVERLQQRLSCGVSETLLSKTLETICSRLGEQPAGEKADIESLLRLSLNSLELHLQKDAVIREGFYSFLAAVEESLKTLRENMPETASQLEALDMLDHALQRGVPADPDKITHLLGVAGDAVRLAVQQLNHVNTSIRSSIEEQQSMMAVLSEQLDKAEAEARKDALTQLANRRRLSEFLEGLGEQPAVLLSLDLDHFKRVNDTYGHEAGDEVLAYVSRVYLDNTRETDLVARYGGEEFCIILPDQQIEHARSIAEEIRQAVALRPVHCLGHAIPVTVSIGVARRKWGEPVREWLARGDKALYEAKERGRNRVVVS